MSDWQSWSVSEWNERLFEHLFGATGSVVPVKYIPATRFDLKRVTGDTSADPDEVERLFVDRLRVSPRRVRDLLSTNSAEFWHAQRRPVPGYFVYLVLTCLVAAGGEEGMLNIGQFRERLRQLLRHPPGTSYDLAGLGALWRSFEQWLESRAERGECRRLQLPDPGSMVRIGYSLRLAFPSFRDRRKMAEIFGDLQGEVPSIREARERIRNHRDEFDEQSRLLTEFDDFESRCRRKGLDFGDHPFWTVVLDAVSLDYATASRTRPRVGLVIPEPSALDLSVRLMVSALPPGVKLPSNVSLDALDDEVGGFKHVVSLDGRSDSGRVLMAGQILAHWKALSGSPLVKSVQQGVLLFARDESNWPVTRFSLPEAGREVWLLAKTGRLPKLLPLAFDAGVRPPQTPSLYPGWEWLGPFDAEQLEGLDRQFPDVTCFQPTVAGPALRLVGGARTGAAYLGTATALPWVVSRRARQVERLGVMTGQRQALERAADDTFWDVSGVQLSGDYVFIARDGAKEIGRLSARFVSDHVGVGYKEPVSPQALRAESADVEVVSWEAALESTNEELEYPYGQRIAKPQLVAASALRFSGLLSSETAEVIPATAPISSCATFVEVAAARSTSRAGLPEGEFLQLLTHVLRVAEGPSLWEVARAWIEAGYFDALSPQSWESRTYFARTPRLVVWRDDAGPAATLVGLAPSEVRMRAHAEAKALGLDAATPPSVTPWVSPLPIFRATDERDFDKLACQIELPAPSRLRPLEAFASSPSAVVAQAEEVFPSGYARQGVWLWRKGYFARTADGTQGATLTWLTHPRAPSRYAVEWDGGARYFRSRTWAFLWALALRGEPVFAYDDADRLIRLGPTQAHVPVPVARALACVGGVPGPFSRPNGHLGYANPTAPAARRALGSVWFDAQRRIPPRASALARSLVHRAHSAPASKVPIPPGLARRFQPFAHDRNVAAVLQSRFPVSLVPHLAKLASLLNALSP